MFCGFPLYAVIVAQKNRFVHTYFLFFIDIFEFFRVFYTKKHVFSKLLSLFPYTFCVRSRVLVCLQSRTALSQKCPHRRAVQNIGFFAQNDRTAEPSRAHGGKNTGASSPAHADIRPRIDRNGSSRKTGIDERKALFRAVFPLYGDASFAFCQFRAGGVCRRAFAFRCGNDRAGSRHAKRIRLILGFLQGVRDSLRHAADKIRLIGREP